MQSCYMLNMVTLFETILWRTELGHAILFNPVTYWKWSRYYLQTYYLQDEVKLF